MAAQAYDAYVDPDLSALPPMPPGYPTSGSSNRIGRAKLAARRQAFVAFDALAQLPRQERDGLQHRLEKVFAYKLGLYENGQWLDWEPDEPRAAGAWRREKAEAEKGAKAAAARAEEAAVRADTPPRIPLFIAVLAAGVLLQLALGRHPVWALFALAGPAGLTAWWLGQLVASGRTRRRHGRRPRPAVTWGLVLLPFAGGTVASGLDAFAQHGWLNSFIVAVCALPVIGIPAALLGYFIGWLAERLPARQLKAPEPVLSPATVATPEWARPRQGTLGDVLNGQQDIIGSR